MSIQYKDTRRVKVLKKGGNTPFIIRRAGREVRRIRYPLTDENTSNIVYEIPSVTLKQPQLEVVNAGSEFDDETTSSSTEFSANIEVSSRHWFLRSHRYLNEARHRNRLAFGLFLHPTDKTTLSGRFYLGTYDWERIIPIQTSDTSISGSGDGLANATLSEPISHYVYAHLVNDTTTISQLPQALTTLNTRYGITGDKKVARDFKVNKEKQTIELGPALYYLDGKVNPTWQFSLKTLGWGSAVSKRLIRNYVSTPPLQAKLKLLPEWDGKNPDTYKLTHIDFPFNAYPDNDKKVWKLQLANGEVVTISETPKAPAFNVYWNQGGVEDGGENSYYDTGLSGTRVEKVNKYIEHTASIFGRHDPATMDYNAEDAHLHLYFYKYNKKYTKIRVQLTGLLNGEVPTPLVWNERPASDESEFTGQPDNSERARNFHKGPNRFIFNMPPESEWGNATFIPQQSLEGSEPLLLNWMNDPALWYSYNFDTTTNVLHVLPTSRAAAALGLTTLSSFINAKYTLKIEYFAINANQSETKIAEEHRTLNIYPMFIPSYNLDAHVRGYVDIENEDIDLNTYTYPVFRDRETTIKAAGNSGVDGRIHSTIRLPNGNNADVSLYSFGVMELFLDPGASPILPVADNEYFGLTKKEYFTEIDRFLGGNKVDINIGRMINQNKKHLIVPYTVPNPIIGSQRETVYLNTDYNTIRNQVYTTKSLPANAPLTPTSVNYAGQGWSNKIIIFRQDAVLGQINTKRIRWSDLALIFYGKHLINVTGIKGGDGREELRFDHHNGDTAVINAPDANNCIWYLLRTGKQFIDLIDRSYHDSEFEENYLTDSRIENVDILLEYNVVEERCTGRFIQPSSALLKLGVQHNPGMYLARHLYIERELYNTPINQPTTNPRSDIIFRNGIPSQFTCIGTYNDSVPQLTSVIRGWATKIRGHHAPLPIGMSGYRCITNVDHPSHTFSTEHVLANFNVNLYRTEDRIPIRTTKLLTMAYRIHP